MYLDNIIIFSDNNDNHLKNIENVLFTLYAIDVWLKLKKCHRLSAKVHFFWQTITTHRRSFTKTHNNGLKDM